MGVFESAAGVFCTVHLLRGLSWRAKPVLVLKNSEYHLVNIGHGALWLCAVGSNIGLKTPVTVCGTVLHPFGSVRSSTVANGTAVFRPQPLSTSTCRRSETAVPSPRSCTRSTRPAF
eukprot:m.292613 g.292613  ORF g.292613 m.292613 type:complete len:117 (-) comp20005_c0_seq1:96-446(-)